MGMGLSGKGWRASSSGGGSPAPTATATSTATGTATPREERVVNETHRQAGPQPIGCGGRGGSRKGCAGRATRRVVGVDKGGERPKVEWTGEGMIERQHGRRRRSTRRVGMRETPKAVFGKGGDSQNHVGSGGDSHNTVRGDRGIAAAPMVALEGARAESSSCLGMGGKSQEFIGKGRCSRRAMSRVGSPYRKNAAKTTHSQIHDAEMSRDIFAALRDIACDVGPCRKIFAMSQRCRALRKCCKNVALSNPCRKSVALRLLAIPWDL